MTHFDNMNIGMKTELSVTFKNVSPRPLDNDEVFQPFNLFYIDLINAL
jgi:hypothetical protein